MNLISKFKICKNFMSLRYREISSAPIIHKCKLLIVGAGTGGCSTAWRFAKKLKKNDIIVLDPAEYHYYQPLFALIAAGVKPYEQCRRPIQSVLPPAVKFINQSAVDYDPCNNIVHTNNGDKIYYDHLVVAVGLVNNYNEIPGLQKALDDPCARVSTIYSPCYCYKTCCCISKFRGGHAIFTFPRQGSKCSGAAQKIMYLTDDYLRKNKLRELTSFSYNTGADALFGVQKYNTALVEIANKRQIAVNYGMDLTEVAPNSAVFTNSNGESINLPFNFLHVTPPMGPPPSLSKCSELVDDRGYLNVDQYTLQHKHFPNVFGLGDCTNTPNSKTAAAVAPQSSVVERNLYDTMRGVNPRAMYNGYGACPILTSHRGGILAEFLYDKEPCETFPFDQSKERYLVWWLKKHVFPCLYWNKIIKGKFNGPAVIRTIVNPFAKKEKQSC